MISEKFDEDARSDPHIAEYERARDLLETPDWRQGLDEMERLAHAGSIMSLLHVSDALRWGWGYSQDLPLAEAWYQVAVKWGSARGLFGLGLTYLEMGRFNEALQELEAAIEKGFPPAYNALAEVYFWGKGVPADKKRALDLWRTGALLGHLPARRNFIKASLHGHYGFWRRIEACTSILPYAIELADVTVATPHTDRLRR